jgi:hypothetical protein
MSREFDCHQDHVKGLGIFRISAGGKRYTNTTDQVVACFKKKGVASPATAPAGLRFPPAGGGVGASGRACTLFGGSTVEQPWIGCVPCLRRNNPRILFDFASLVRSIESLLR